MKPAPFEYVRPESLDEALSALAEGGDDAKVLAGGQSLVPALNMRLLRPSLLVDVNRVAGLGEVATEDGALRVGATVRQADARLDAHPMLAAVLPHVGHTVTRNRGTVCGSIAHADAAAELPLALVAAGGSVIAASARGRREIPAEELFLGPYTTALAQDELVVETVWPALDEDDGFAFAELAQRGGDFALCMAAARARGAELRVVVGSVTPRPTVLDVDPERPGESAAAQVEPWGSIHASPVYLEAAPARPRGSRGRAGEGTRRVIAVDVTVNGRRYREEVEPRLLLSDFLRHRLGLTGTHVGCEHGVCGACTVRLDGVAVRSCLLLAAQVDGAEIVTVEGLAGSGALTPLQEAFHRHHALQCGFCTPGILIAAEDLLARERPPTRDEIVDMLSGQLCRCTGYTPIVDAIAEVAGSVNLALSLLSAAERTPEADALVSETTRLTYAELRARAACIASGLSLRGVEPGDRVACVLANEPETVELYWGCQWLGAVIVPLSHRISDADLDYCIADCEAEVVIRDPGEAQALIAADEHAGALDLDEREASIQLYTSGTTGRPKGVPRSHHAERAGGISQAFQHGLRPGHRTLGVMPLYHTMGIHSLVAASVVGGCFVAHPSWDAEQALGLIEEERIDTLYLAPTLFYDLVQHPRFADFDTSSVLAVAYAGSPMTSALVERVAEAFEPEIFVNHYGSTEIYTFSVQRDQRAKPGCAGRAALNARLRLDPPGEGEILCHMSSDEAFTGYWNRPDADEKAIHDGWYRTGDIGRIDEDGDLWVVGRVDDMVISGGENIHPVEVEDVLARAPGVGEVAVVGAPDDRWGQTVVAYVVVDGDVTAEELDAFCLESDTLARFKRPREYRFVSELPKSPSGKILRRMLRDES